jgi:hypothetical protein
MKITEHHLSLDKKTICIHYADGEVIIIPADKAKKYGIKEVL